MTVDEDLVPLVLVTAEGPLTSVWAIALLTGYSPVEVRELGILSIEDLPDDLVRAARRRAGETAARTNTRDMLTALRFWSGQLFNVELVMRADGVWIPRPDADGWRADAG